MGYRLDLKLFRAALLVVLAGSAVPAAAGPLVTGLRHSASGERTRVVVDVSAACAYTVAYLPDSTGILVRLEAAGRDPRVGVRVVEKNGVRSVNAFDRAGGVDVVVALTRPVTWSDFALGAEGGRPHRIVLDLTPGSRAPDAVAARAEPTSPPAASPSKAAARAVARTRPMVVAIDAGHGGHDAGAIGRYGLVEKKLTLDIARRVAEILNRGDETMRAVLTREGDEYLTLPARNKIAVDKDAAIFVSIHLNSAPSASARGAEIFFVAPAGAERAASKALHSGEAAHDFGLDASGNDDLVHILLDVNQQTVLARSEQLAEAILESVRDRNLLPTRTVKQKSFSVLRTISMPSVLVEAGFLTNTADAKLLRDPDGREKIARAIADGVRGFHRAHPPQRANDAAGRTVVHRVQRGDTLWDLSRRYQTTVARLRELNGLRRSDGLRVGQEIVVQPGD